MKIAIFSDCHMGFDYGGARGEDSFSAFEEALEKSRDADLILVAGDLFDTRVPRQEVFARGARLLSRTKEWDGKAKFESVMGKRAEEVSPLSLKGLPIVCISGNHDRRSPHLTNPVQALEHAGLLLHLHCSTAVFDIEGKKVAVHGMSAVPERYAKEVLLSWNPKPVEGAVNIFLIHQNIDPYIFNPLEPPSLKLEDLPAGFDLYVLGHMHWNDQQRFRGKNLLVAGSTTPTGLHKIESEQKKGVFFFNGEYLDFLPLTKQRKIFWEDVYFSPTVKEDMERAIGKILANEGGEPIIVLKVKGKLPVGSQAPSFRDIENKYSDKALLYIYSNLEGQEFESQLDLIKSLREQRLSPEEYGLQLLKQNLEQAKCGIKIEDIFELLVEGQTEEIYKGIVGERK